MATLFCNQCGAQVEEGSKFCENCGSAVPGRVDSIKDAVKQPLFTPTTQTFTPKILIGLGVLLLVLSLFIDISKGISISLDECVLYLFYEILIGSYNSKISTLILTFIVYFPLILGTAIGIASLFTSRWEIPFISGLISILTPLMMISIIARNFAQHISFLPWICLIFIGGTLLVWGGLMKRRLSANRGANN